MHRDVYCLKWHARVSENKTACFLGAPGYVPTDGTTVLSFAGWRSGGWRRKILTLIPLGLASEL